MERLFIILAALLLCTAAPAQSPSVYEWSMQDLFNDTQWEGSLRDTTVGGIAYKYLKVVNQDSVTSKPFNLTGGYGNIDLLYRADSLQAGFTGAKLYYGIWRGGGLNNAGWKWNLIDTFAPADHGASLRVDITAQDWFEMSSKGCLKIVLPAGTESIGFLFRPRQFRLRR